MDTKRRLFRIVAPVYPAFNIYSKIASKTTALGPICVGSAANRLEGWDVEIIDENNYRRGPRDDHGHPDHVELQRRRPADVVGFYGGLTCTVVRLYELASIYRQMGVTTIAGGQHFVGETIPEAFDSGIDYVVVGEAEETIVELLQAIDEHREPVSVAGLVYRSEGAVLRTPDRPERADFDRFPPPDFSLLRYARVVVYPVSWVRGCGMNCEFCTVKGKVRCPPAEYLVDQVVRGVEKFGAKHFFIVDDLFGQRRKETLRACRLLKEFQERSRITLDFTVQIRLDKATDTELLQAMRSAGVNMAAIGFESPIPEELQAMAKRLKPDDMVSMALAFRKSGFLVHGMFMFGYPLKPGQRCELPVAERVKTFRRFIRKARIDTIQILIAGPLPGTEMTARLRQQNRLFSKETIGWEFYDGNFPLFEPDPPLTAESLMAARETIMSRFYRFDRLFIMILDLISFPAVVLCAKGLGNGWRRWYRSWRNALVGFTGWIIMRKWARDYASSAFDDKLEWARNQMKVRLP